MTGAAPAHVRPAVLLAVDSAIAVLEENSPVGRAQRDLAATTALRRATGRSDILVERRESGRPKLRDPYPELGVSMAGRGEILLVGFSPRGRVGVDVEPEDSVPIADVDRLSADHFSAEEAHVLSSASSPESARDMFLRLWVAKEAALKLTGRGVFDGLREPNFSRQIDQMCSDGTVVRMPRSATLPSFRVAVRRLAREYPTVEANRASVAFYCALAVCET